MPNITYDFRGKVVLITGSSSGIGAGAALLFAKSGADLVINGRNAKKLSEVAKKCQKISPNNSKVLQVLADVSKEEDCKRLVDSTIAEFGKLDILVNNAGNADYIPITNPNYFECFKNFFQTNLYSVVYLTHLCVEYLAKTKGNIIYVSGIPLTGKLVSSISMCKSSIDMFTKCMAAELGDEGIRVNSVNPGAVKTDILESIGLTKLFDKYGDAYPVGRYGVPEDIANDILFLASEESSFKTGTLLVSDGGHLAANVPHLT